LFVFDSVESLMAELATHFDPIEAPAAPMDSPRMLETTQVEVFSQTDGS
jgi:hypothetical protein